MKKQKGLGLIGVLLIIGALIITAGGMVWRKKPFLPTPTPLPQSNPSPTIFGGKPIYNNSLAAEDGHVRIAISKAAYSRNEEIEISIKNISDVDFFTQGLMCHQAYYFEKKTNQGWEKVGECLMSPNFVDEPYGLAPGKERGGSLPTSYKSDSGYVYDLTLGTYRYKFGYHINGVGGFIIYTPEFKIL